MEKKWQGRWEKDRIFEVKEGGKKKKFYVLEMYPYPSGSGLHMGHAFNYTIGDIYARFKRMLGFNVLYPMGYDSFGLPAENAAIKAGIHPHKFTEDAVANFIKQQKALGLSYDWSRVLMTHRPDYYRWNQFFFLKFLEKGLAYRKKAPVNYCPKCKTVLANEQVHDGKCLYFTSLINFPIFFPWTIFPSLTMSLMWSTLVVARTKTGIPNFSESSKAYFVKSFISCPSAGSSMGR